MIEEENRTTQTQKDTDIYKKRLMRGESETSAKAGLKSFEPLEIEYIKQKTKRKIIDWTGVICGAILLIITCLGAIFFLWLLLYALSEKNPNGYIFILLLLIDVVFLGLSISIIYDSIKIKYIRSKDFRIKK